MKIKVSSIDKIETIKVKFGSKSHDNEIDDEKYNNIAELEAKALGRDWYYGR